MKNVWVSFTMLFIVNNVWCSDQSCPKDHCDNCYSCLCSTNFRANLDCTHQLSNRLSNSSCEMGFIRENERNKEVVLHSWRYLYHSEERPFLLQVYRQKLRNAFYRTGFNLSFQDFKSNDLRYRFRFRNMGDEGEDLGREFILRNLPPSSESNSVFWDCPFFNNYVGKEQVLTVIDSKDSGGEYSFIVPDPKRINPNETAISDWQLLVMLDLGAYNRNQEAVVTVQLAPFSNLTYRVELLSCQQRDSCHNGTLVSSKEFHVMNLDDVDHGQRSMTFDIQEPGIYIISAQLLHESCLDEDCFHSQTTLLEIKPDHRLWYVILSGILLLVLTIALSLLCLHKAKQYKKMLSDLSIHPASLLVVYLPESENYYRFVETLADLLQGICFVKTYLVDRDVGQMNPHEWTMRRMEEVDRVVFLIPSSENRSVRSIMPVQHQWGSSLSHFSDSYFIRYGSTKAASILIPSERVCMPVEIAGLRRFHLLQELTSFVSWIHNTSSQLDRWFLWWLLIHSRKGKMMLHHLKSSLKRISDANKVSPTSGRRSLGFDRNIATPTESLPLFSVNQHSLLGNSEDAEDRQSEDSTDNFHPDIKSVESLLIQCHQQQSGDPEDDANSYSDETGSLVDDLFF
uniref:Interleukin 17 receptor n=1 Tax=Lysmata vittata TaxID=749979 RepID=A0A977XF10_9EUCA|nr:interleukin 17 receptor [Lysmata vittata]